MLSFKSWLKSKVIIDFDNKQTLDDFVADKDFPESVRKYVILDYLNKKANNDVVAVFEDYYEDYINDITQDFEV